MKRITLAKALKLKSRLASNLKTAKENIESNNSIILGGKRKVSVTGEYEKYCELQNAIINLKTSINSANISIQHHIYKSSELKSELTMWKTICTDEGIIEKKHSWSSSDGEIEKTAVFSFSIVQEKIKEIQKELDDIQDILDSYNHTTFIDIDDYITNLV